MYDLIIIGSGPAGLSAAVYGKRAGLNLLVLEKAPMSGGQVLNTYEVDNYLGMPGINGFDMGMQFREHADRLGAEFADAEVLGVERITAVEWIPTVERIPAEAATEDIMGDCRAAAKDSMGDLQAAVRAAEIPAEKRAAAKAAGSPGFLVHTTEGDFEARTVLAAVGADHAHLGVPGEEAFSGRGVSYCATCDGAFFRSKKVVVVGGGDVALEDAIYLSRFCEKVTLVHRRDELRGARILQQELLAKENAEVLYSHTVQEIQGTDQVTGVLLKDVKSGAERVLETDGVFIAVGIIPQTEIFRELAACDEQGYLLAGEDCVTNVEGFYVAGDARKKPLRQIITAVADGANAVTSINSYLMGH